MVSSLLPHLGVEASPHVAEDLRVFEEDLHGDLLDELLFRSHVSLHEYRAVDEVEKGLEDLQVLSLDSLVFATGSHKERVLEDHFYFVEEVLLK